VMQRIIVLQVVCVGGGVGGGLLEVRQPAAATLYAHTLTVVNEVADVSTIVPGGGGAACVQIGHVCECAGGGGVLHLFVVKPRGYLLVFHSTETPAGSNTAVRFVDDAVAFSWCCRAQGWT
jgi:hypothetical protein